MGQPNAVLAPETATRPGRGVTHATFPLFNPATPASELGEHIASIRRHSFVLDQLSGTLSTLDPSSLEEVAEFLEQ